MDEESLRLLKTLRQKVYDENIRMIIAQDTIVIPEQKRSKKYLDKKYAKFNLFFK